MWLCECVCLCSCQLAKRGRCKGSGLLQKVHKFQMDSQTCICGRICGKIGPEPSRTAH